MTLQTLLTKEEPSMDSLNKPQLTCLRTICFLLTFNPKVKGKTTILRPIFSTSIQYIYRSLIPTNSHHLLTRWHSMNLNQKIEIPYSPCHISLNRFHSGRHELMCSQVIWATKTWLDCGTQGAGTLPYRLGDSFTIQGCRRSVLSALLCPAGGLSSLLRLRQIRILCCVVKVTHGLY